MCLCICDKIGQSESIENLLSLNTQTQTDFNIHEKNMIKKTPHSSNIQFVNIFSGFSFRSVVRMIKEMWLGHLHTDWTRFVARALNAICLLSACRGLAALFLLALLCVVVGEHYCCWWWRWFRRCRCFCCYNQAEKRRVYTHLLLKYNVFAFPVFHHAERLQCTHDIIRIYSHFL